jgi:iron complex transport system substrate-binding protein
MNTHPSRIVCLGAETAETLCLLGEGQRIVGLAGCASRLPQAQRRVFRVSLFTTERIERICALEPDLVLGSAERHADMLLELAQQGIAVHLFNQRSLSSIFDMIRVLGGIVGREGRAVDLAASLEWHVESIRAASAHEHRPRVYFEEWDEPQICGSSWISELIEIAGGEDCFGDRAATKHVAQRIIADSTEVVDRAPDIVIGSWSGRRFLARRVVARTGWNRVPAVLNGELHGIQSSLILQPGPVALTEGLDELCRIVTQWRERRTRIFQTAMVPHAVAAQPVFAGQVA